MVDDAPCNCQGDKFQLCPLGMQFDSPQPLKPFDLYEFNVQVPGRANSAQSVTCTGAVVRCQREKKRGPYRVWIQFLDLPAKAREKIKCCSKKGKYQCCYCENF